MYCGTDYGDDETEYAVEKQSVRTSSAWSTRFETDQNNWAFITRMGTAKRPKHDGSSDALGGQSTDPTCPSTLVDPGSQEDPHQDGEARFWKKNPENGGCTPECGGGRQRQETVSMNHASVHFYRPVRCRQVSCCFVECTPSFGTATSDDARTLFDGLGHGLLRFEWVLGQPNLPCSRPTKDIELKGPVHSDDDAIQR